ESVRRPVDLSVQRGRGAFAVLLEAQVDRGERGSGPGDVVDDEPAGERVAAAAVSEPVETAECGIVERVPGQVRVIAALELGDGGRPLEISVSKAVPLLDVEGHSTGRGGDADHRVERRV